MHELVGARPMTLRVSLVTNTTACILGSELKGGGMLLDRERLLTCLSIVINQDEHHNLQVGRITCPRQYSIRPHHAKLAVHMHVTLKQKQPWFSSESVEETSVTSLHIVIGLLN